MRSAEYLATPLIDESSDCLHRGVEGEDDSLDGIPGRVGLTPLDQGEGGGRDARVAGEGFLGRAAFLAELADGLAEGWLRSR